MSVLKQLGYSMRSKIAFFIRVYAPFIYCIIILGCLSHVVIVTANAVFNTIIPMILFLIGMMPVIWHSVKQYREIHVY